MIAGVVFQHESVACLLRELKRNGELRDLCGFDPSLGAAAVSSDDAFSHFLDVVMQHQDALQEIFDALVDELMRELPDLGTTLAVDSKAIPSFGRPVSDQAKAIEPDRRRDTDADWGKKTYKGTRQDGTTWQKVTKWFGYKLHLLVDSKYELPLSFGLDKASSSDYPSLLPLVERLHERHPETLERSQELAADKGYDSGSNNHELYETYHVKPIIDKRTLWRDGETTRPLFPKRADVFVYDEDGHVQCVCPQTGEVRDLAFAGFERDRCTLKYRCPAAALGLTCKGRADCEKMAAFERHYIRGQEKMKTRMTLAFVIMLAMALGRIRIGQQKKLRSLTAPIRLAA